MLANQQKKEAPDAKAVHHCCEEGALPHVLQARALVGTPGVHAIARRRQMEIPAAPNADAPIRFQDSIPSDFKTPAAELGENTALST